MKSGIFSIITLTVLLSACFSLSSAIGSDTLPQDFEQTAALIESGNFKFTVRSASPSGGRTVQITSSYELKASDGSYEAHLPYFGRVYSGGYGDGGSVEFKGEPEKLEITRKDNRNKIILRFSIRSTTEKYDVKLEVGKSGFGSLVVSSPKRQTISYNGLVSVLED